MRFVQPLMLWWLVALPLLVLAGWLAAHLRRRALQRFAGGAAHAGRFSGQVSRHRRAAKAMLLLVGLACAIVGLARPQWGTRMEEIRGRGTDVAVVLDNSLSMAVEDVAPSRLGQARHAIGSLLGRLAGDRVALVTFAGEATLACPLTLDHGAVRLFLDTLDAESVPVPGTSLAAALRTAVQALGEPQPGEQRGRAIVLFSDGEDHEGEVDKMVDLLERRGVMLYTVGCGTSRGGPIPLRDAGGVLTGYKKDKQDKVVTSRLDESALRQLALDSGGNYYRATPAEGEIDEIAHTLSGMDKHDTGTALRRRYEERFQWPLALALLFLLGETLIGDRRTVRSREVFQA